MILDYRGYNVRFDLDDDEVFMITYEPKLPAQLEKQYSSCKLRKDCKKTAIKAIDLALGQPNG